MTRAYRIGTRVRVITVGAGCDSGRRGVIVSHREVPTNGHGIPQLEQGHYNPLDADDYAIRDEQGNLFTMNGRYLNRED